MNYGVFQEFYSAEIGRSLHLKGDQSVTGLIGTTSNGVMYLSMPPLFLLFTSSLVRYRQTAAIAGTVITCASLILSSYSTQVWHLVATQGVLAALGSALVYSPLTLSLGEWFNNHNRALAYGVVLSCKNIVGSSCPFLMRSLLDRLGLSLTLRVWAAIVGGTSLFAILLVPTHPSRLAMTEERARRVPLHFLGHAKFYVYAVAIALQSSGYGIPQTYLNTYAHEAANLSSSTATLLLTIFNAPGIFSSLFFGFINDNKRFSLSASYSMAISSVSSCLSALLFWGLTSPQGGSMALLMLFSITFGFFASGYSATWGGVVNELESEASRRNEAIDSGLVYGLLNGARGLGYVGGGIAGVHLLETKIEGAPLKRWGYETNYGSLIILTGLTTLFGGWELCWRAGAKVIRQSS